MNLEFLESAVTRISPKLGSGAKWSQLRYQLINGGFEKDLIDSQEKFIVNIWLKTCESNFRSSDTTPPTTPPTNSSRPILHPRSRAAAPGSGLVESLTDGGDKDDSVCSYITFSLLSFCYLCALEQ